MDVIQRNFFRLLRAGALNEYEVLEPMSDFKWKRLFQLIDAQEVMPIAIKGIKHHQFEKDMAFPFHLFQESKRDSTPPSKQSVLSPIMSNPLLKKRLQGIHHDERHAIDTSTETLQLLDMITSNTHHMINKGVSLKGILGIGSYLRTKGDKVDFVKLDRWLSHLHLLRMAQLEGCILIEAFKFDPSEIPFVKNIERKTSALVLRTLSYTVADTVQEWHFRQGKSGFVRNNTSIMWHNLQHCIRFMKYAPIETVSNFFYTFAHSLSEIEE